MAYYEVFKMFRSDISYMRSFNISVERYVKTQSRPVWVIDNDNFRFVEKCIETDIGYSKDFRIEWAGERCTCYRLDGKCWITWRIYVYVRVE